MALVKTGFNLNESMENELESIAKEIGTDKYSLTVLHLFSKGFRSIPDPDSLINAKVNGVDIECLI